MVDGIVLAPELDTVDLGASSSTSSVVANIVDLSLNLGPPPIPPPDPRVRLVLELALGRHDFHESVQVSRQNWPRFEPDMSGLLPAGAEDESSARTNSRHQEIDRSEGTATPTRAPLQESRLQARELEPLLSGRDDEELPFSNLRQRLLRNRRHLRHSRRPRQLLVSMFDRVEASAAGGSTTQDRIVGADDDSRSNMPFAISTGITNALDMPSSKAAFMDSIAKHEDDKETKVGHVGAHFECNICLEMATDPVVTCCGHLFCWSCLYQWLHVHSIQKKECPVCKGLLSNGVITPIYGRGNVKDTGSSLDNIPPRPQALRLNGKRCRQERTALERFRGGVRLERAAQERLDGDVRGPGGVGMSELETERSEQEGPNREGVFLNRERVLQRLQQCLEERSRLRQRITGQRAGALQSSPLISGTAQGGLDSISLGTQDLEQYHRGQMLAWMHMNRIETTESLSHIQARMEGLREDLANMQRSIQISSSPPGLTDTLLSEEVTSSGGLHQLERLSDDAQIRPPRIETPMQQHDVQPQQRSAELTEVLWREWLRAVSGASTSFDIEPGSSHARKRRRLN